MLKPPSLLGPYSRSSGIHFFFDNKLQNLKQNLGNINSRVINLINKWKRYHLTIHGQLTIVKYLLLAQYIYIGTVMYILDEEEMEKIQNLLNHFLQHNEVISTKKNGYQMTYYMHPQVREALT
jgi:hypothetical protein